MALGLPQALCFPWMLCLRRSAALALRWTFALPSQLPAGVATRAPSPLVSNSCCPCGRVCLTSSFSARPLLSCCAADVAALLQLLQPGHALLRHLSAVLRRSHARQELLVEGLSLSPAVQRSQASHVALRCRASAPTFVHSTHPSNSFESEIFRPQNASHAAIPQMSLLDVVRKTASPKRVQQMNAPSA